MNRDEVARALVETARLISEGKIAPELIQIDNETQGVEDPPNSGRWRPKPTGRKLLTFASYIPEKLLEKTGWREEPIKIVVEPASLEQPEVPLPLPRKEV